MSVGTFLKAAAFGAASLWLASPAAADGRTQTCQLDDAADPYSKKPRKRAEAAMTFRVDASEREYHGSKKVCHLANDDTDPGAKFSKTLPHNEFGEVDPEAFSALQDCISSGDFQTCEDIPAGAAGGKLVNPLGGIAVDMPCPAGSGVTIPPAPALDSPELAANLAECYWMAIARDVSFADYGENEITVAAAANLVSMPGFPLESNGVAMSADGTSIDPHKQLFRASFVGGDKGPMISQLLANNFVIDSIPATVKQSTYAAGINYMTDWDTFLHIQNGGAATGTEQLDGTLRYIRNGRDLARLAATDIIYTPAFRGALVLMAKGGFLKAGANGPYASSTRQAGFVNWGVSHILRALGEGECAQRASWYQKWHVHMMLRPEALAGLVHSTMHGDLEYSIDASLLTNSELLDRVVASNAEQNADTERDSYLLSQVTKVGSPAHPSYPAGHAVQNGAFATILKAMCGLERGQICVPNPIESSADGLELLPYVPTADEKCIGLDGVETTGLNFEGEINKMATNIGLGRSHMGVHYRFDSIEGIILGETVAVRMLHIEIMALPEEWPCEFNLFRGNTIKLYHDGTFSIDGKMCSGRVYTGVDDC